MLSTIEFDKPIEFIDSPKLLALVNDVQVSPQVTIEKTKACPKCSGELVERTAKRGPKAGNTFLGCFPKCRYTE
ncbi:topoisomerase DNA-binding C4 zinc finger domain-containing protein [Aestuariibacter sp. A3R04]|uniref:topoisomerase DNA-binding C4 zinc finger domain-containing protein n=1 Tax=Aestuariibacter sp. A3R04 TaxID=2841571 RepID=UPI0020915BDB|nr:topoisomerase DNA-binding C4 zinc finger domain-containing protein [Aestuariibacter sp. A3R04]